MKSYEETIQTVFDRMGEEKKARAHRKAIRTRIAAGCGAGVLGLAIFAFAKGMPGKSPEADSDTDIGTYMEGNRSDGSGEVLVKDPAPSASSTPDGPALADHGGDPITPAPAPRADGGANGVCRIILTVELDGKTYWEKMKQYADAGAPVLDADAVTPGERLGPVKDFPGSHLSTDEGILYRVADDEKFLLVIYPERRVLLAEETWMREQLAAIPPEDYLPLDGDAIGWLVVDGEFYSQNTGLDPEEYPAGRFIGMATDFEGAYRGDLLGADRDGCRLEDITGRVYTVPGKPEILRIELENGGVVLLERVLSYN